MNTQKTAPRLNEIPNYATQCDPYKCRHRKLHPGVPRDLEQNESSPKEPNEYGECVNDEGVEKVA